ncbi:hypothetical protein UlMin_027622 [Ulmus minor]
MSWILSSISTSYLPELVAQNLWVHNLVMSLDFGEMTELKKNYLSGWVGYFSYDTVRYVEKRKVPFSMAPMDDRNLADIHLGLYDDVLVFDHMEKVILHKNIFLYPLYVIHWVRLDRYSSIETAYEDGVKHLASLLAGVQSLTPPRLNAGYIDIHTHHFRGSLENSNMTSEEYKKMVLECFERRTFADPFEIYRALRVVNPSPYMTHLRARGCILVASSLEILTRVNKNLELQLLSTEKQCAEHIMLVDLGQNDVGKMVSAFIDEFSHLSFIDNLLMSDSLSFYVWTLTMDLTLVFVTSSWLFHLIIINSFYILLNREEKGISDELDHFMMDHLLASYKIESNLYFLYFLLFNFLFLASLVFKHFFVERLY